MARTDPKLDLIAGVPLFGGCRGRDLEEVGRLADEVDVPAGKVLIADPIGSLRSRGDASFRSIGIEGDPRSAPPSVKRGTRRSRRRWSGARTGLRIAAIEGSRHVAVPGWSLGRGPRKKARVSR